MQRKPASMILLFLLVVSALVLARNVQPEKASGTLVRAIDNSNENRVLAGSSNNAVGMNSPSSRGSLGTSDMSYPPSPIIGTFTTVMSSNTTVWDATATATPYVLFDSQDGLYKMWYWAMSDPVYLPPYYVYRHVIAYAESVDGVTWTNKTIVHDTGSGTYYITGAPWVLKENGTYLMWHMDWYEWVGADWSRYIAFMRSPDGVNWPGFMSADDTKVLSAQGQASPQGDGRSVSEPWVIHTPSQGYAMWYSVYDYPGTGTVGPQKIWTTTSVDGVSWSNRQLSLPYVPGSWEGNVAHPSVVKEEDGTYTMYYAAAFANGSSSIGVAKSFDGISWTDRTQLLKPSDLSANITYISEPSYFQDVDGKRYLYFTFTYSDGQTKFGRVQLESVDWWPMFHHDLTHTGYSTSTAPNTNQTPWNYATGSYVWSSPAVAGGVVYVGSDDCNVYALNATTGTLVWCCRPGSSVFSSPAVAGGVVYVGSTNGKIYAFGKQVDVYLKRSREPAPMGIADYGIGPSGPYEYATKSFVGIVTVASLSTNSSLSHPATWMTFQLNVNLAFNTSYGQYVYWIQNVAVIDTSSNWVDFLNDVWNITEPGAIMSASGVFGNGQVSALYSDYYCDCINASQSLPGNNITLTYPTTITFNVTSGVSSSGEPTVSFAYDDGYGLITYDTVTFANVPGLTSLPVFEVNGFSYNPWGNFYDSELILGGPGGGESTTNIQSDVRLQLEYWNGHNYEMVPNAYNFGSDTGEKINNTLSQFSYCPENGTINAWIQPGAGQLSKLYDQSQIGIINITSPLTSGTLYVTDASDPNATAWQIPFVDGEVTVTLYPGCYDLQLYNQYDELFDQGNFTVNAGQTLHLQAPFSRPATHNIAAISAVSTKTVIGKGFSDNVTILVADKGDYAETFNVTAYANDTVIGTQQVSLNATNRATLTFTWNTTGFAEGNYTISAHAWPVAGEIDASDNTRSGGWILVSLPGDVNGDGNVDVSDVYAVAKAYGTTLEGPNPPGRTYEPNCDIDGDGIIDVTDYYTTCRHYGEFIP